MDIKTTKKTRSGQAMIELICGLVGITIIVAVLLQINMYSREHMMAVVRARGAMADSMTSESPSTGSKISYLSDWDTGPDDHDYSQDDIAKTGSASSFVGALAEGVKVEGLKLYVGDTNRVVAICETMSSSLVEAFDALTIEVEGEPIEFLPIVRQLVYGAEEITPKHRVFMPWIINVDLN